MDSVTYPQRYSVSEHPHIGFLHWVGHRRTFVPGSTIKVSLDKGTPFHPGFFVDLLLSASCAQDG